MRVCARARLARARSPHSMSPTHFHGASAPPPPNLRGTRDWLNSQPAPPSPRRGPPSLSRAPINQPRGCQSSGGSPRPPAAPAAATAIAAPGPRRGRWPSSSRPGLCKQSAISFRGPGLGRERTGLGKGGWGGAGTAPRSPPSKQFLQCRVYFFTPSSSSRLLFPESQAPSEHRGTQMVREQGALLWRTMCWYQC